MAHLALSTASHENVSCSQVSVYKILRRKILHAISNMAAIAKEYVITQCKGICGAFFNQVCSQVTLVQQFQDQ